jgi:hypothetical protein
LDRLVELRVLTENGDAIAAAKAARWLDIDAAARHVWETVEHTCRLLRTTVEPAPPSEMRSP